MKFAKGNTEAAKQKGKPKSGKRKRLKLEIQKAIDDFNYLFPCLLRTEKQRVFDSLFSVLSDNGFRLVFCDKCDIHFLTTDKRKMFCSISCKNARMQAKRRGRQTKPE